MSIVFAMTDRPRFVGGWLDQQTDWLSGGAHERLYESLSLRRDRADAARFSVSIASTNSALFIRDRPLTSSRFANPIR